MKTSKKKLNRSKKKKKSAEPLRSLSAVRKEVQHQLENGVSQVRKHLPFVEKNIKFLADEIQAHLPGNSKHRRTGKKRKSSTSPLSNLSHKTPFQEIQELSSKKIKESLENVTERLQHRLNLPSRKDLQKINDQITQLDQKISILQEKEDARSI